MMCNTFDHRHQKRGRILTTVIVAAMALLMLSALWAQSIEEAQYYQTTSLPVGRQQHGAAVIGDYIYIFGGNVAGEGFSASSMYAPIRPDGQLGQWQETTPLPGPLTYIGNSTVVRGRIVYVAGGNVRSPDGQINDTSRVVSMAAQLDDGQLSRWLPSRQFPGPGLQICAAVATSTHLYVIGGADVANNPQRVVFYAPFVEGGLLGEWRTGPNLPIPLWFHMAGVVGNRIYVWGGTTGTNYEGAVANTFYADVASDGSISPWQEVDPLPQPIYFSAAAEIDDTLFNFSGRYRSGEYTNDVLFAIASQNPNLEWTRVRANVPLHRYLAPGVDHRRGIIFFPGGRSASREGDAAIIREVFGYRVPRVEIAEEFTAGTQQPGQPTPTQDGPRPPVIIGSGEGPTWLSFREAEIQALRTGKNIMLYFYTPRARPCQELDENLFPTQEFGAIADRYVLGRVDAAEQRDLAITYGVFRVPTIVIINPRTGNPEATYVRDSINLRELQSAP